MNELAASQSLNRYDRFIRPGGSGAGAASGPSNAARLRRRYETIFVRHRDLFKGARVLDINSGSGFWSLAALDAGAAHVVGIEDAPANVEAAKKAFGEYGVNAAAYRFVDSEAPAALRKAEPKAFDVILCHGFLEQSDPRFAFQQFARLQPKHVILDTRISQGKGPIVRIRQKSGEQPKGNAARRFNALLSVPNHEMITFFCDYFQCRWRQIDWKSMGIADWTGLHDYEQDRRRTYILEPSAA